VPEKPTIAVLGAGNGAFAHAADLSIKGFEVGICEVPEFGGNLSAVKEKGGITLVITGNPGLIPGFGRLNKVTTDPKEALEGADVVLVVVPSFAQRRFAEFCAPYIRSDQLVVLSPGNFGGCLEFWQALNDSGSEAKPLLCETECMTYSGFKSGPAEVEVSGYKHGHTMAAFPGNRTPEALERLSSIFPTVKGAVNILETGLRNVNTVMHAPITVLNAGRIEATEGKFLFYWEGVTHGVGAVVDRVEAERLQIGHALGIDLTPTRDVLLEYYGHSGASGDTLPGVMRTNPVYEIDWAPPRLQHRFLTEDIPYGMVPMERMGEFTGVLTPVITAVIELASALLQEDLRQQARDLDSLGLGDLSLKELKRFFNEGPKRADSVVAGVESQ
jgi:opine dehydrogenase